MARLRRRALSSLGKKAAIGASIVLVCAFAIYFLLLRNLPDLASLEDYRPALTSVVFDRFGRSIGEFYEHRRRITPLKDLPPVLLLAFIAAEDNKFYQHEGVDYASILRAAWANFRAGGEKLQGASTITQQLVKQLLLSPERTYRRKIREVILARRIEKRFTKDKIIFLYLNEIYFGSGAYGIGEASETYFSKKPGELNVGEIALLAGLPKAPGRNSPYRNPVRAESRRQYVLSRMHQEGYIDTDTYTLASTNVPQLAQPPGETDFDVAAYFSEEVRRRLVTQLGNEIVLRGGLSIETTLDVELQRTATKAVRKGLEALDRRQGYIGPVRSVDPESLQNEIEKIGKENGLITEGTADVQAEFPANETLLGVITSIDSVSKTAQVAFAPGVQGQISVTTVSWAREREGEEEEEERLETVTEIEQVFQAGDVTYFRKIEKIDETLHVSLFQKPEVQAALLCFNVKDGEVLALVGGYDFSASEFNRATQALRQPGSAFKPIIYAAALENGFTPASILYDRPVVYEDEETGFMWRPQNYGRKFLGPLTLNEALARSVNNATIHLLRDLGIGNVIDFAKRLGIAAPLTRDLSLALGSSPISLLELTRAYSIFANRGQRVEPIFIRRVLDRDGNILMENLPLDPSSRDGENDLDNIPLASTREETEELIAAERQVLSETHAYLSTHLLRNVIDSPRGTGRRARSLGRSVAGKTGTTNEQGDAWFTGFSPEIATGVWVGFDDRRGLGKGETGSRAALPIWIDFMNVALKTRPNQDFSVPEGIVFARIDEQTGLLADTANEKASFHAFIEGTEPTKGFETEKSGSKGRLRLDF